MKFDTILEIDLYKLKNNVKLLCESYNDYKYKVANLKDNAYGMGFKIVKTLIQNGINYILVGPLKDAIDIRRFNNDINIIVGYYIDIEQIYDAISNNLIITIPSLEYLKKITELNIRDDLKLQLLIDNGSNKMGLKNKLEVKEAINLIDDSEHLILDGIYTDLTSVGIEDDFYYKQVNNFYKIINDCLDKNIIIHLNEPIMYHQKLEYINGIRFDLSLIGIEENIEDNFITNMKIKNIQKRYNDLQFPDIDLKLIFTITSEVMDIGKVKKGDLIGRNYIAKEDMDIAVIPVGHKDGITKAIKYVGINNYKRDIIADDIDHLIVTGDDVKIHDKVYIVNEERGIYDFLTLLKTNRYYLMSVLNRNLRKKYINGESNGEDYL